LNHLFAEDFGIWFTGGQTHSHNTLIVFVTKHAIHDELCFCRQLLGQLGRLTHDKVGRVDDQKLSYGQAHRVTVHPVKVVYQLAWDVEHRWGYHLRRHLIQSFSRSVQRLFDLLVELGQLIWFRIVHPNPFTKRLVLHQFGADGTRDKISHSHLSHAKVDRD